MSCFIPSIMFCFVLLVCCLTKKFTTQSKSIWKGKLAFFFHIAFHSIPRCNVQVNKRAH